MATEVFTGVFTVSPGSGSHDFTMPPGMHAATIILDVVNPAESGLVSFVTRHPDLTPWTNVPVMHVEWDSTATTAVGFNFWITAMDEPVPQLPYGGE
jgi:hypothetical protein